MIKWTVNLKSFEIKVSESNATEDMKWTVNLKSFEIYDTQNFRGKKLEMNCKLEKFWNI